MNSCQLIVLFLTTSCLQLVKCDPHHPHLYNKDSKPANMTELCKRHQWFLETNHIRHLYELKYRTCMIALDKYKKREEDCYKAMDPKDIGYCLAPENYKDNFNQLKKCLNETKLDEEESKQLKECMGYRGKKSKRKRDLHWLTTEMANLTQLCGLTMINYYLNHPSHNEAHHTCTVEIIGAERVAKRMSCHSKYPIKSYDDFKDKCVKPEEHKADFEAAAECFDQNKISEQEKEDIMICTFEALGKLDKAYLAQALIYKPFKDLDEFCIKSRNYWHDEDEIYKDRFEACSMKINPNKTEVRWVCETFDIFDQNSVEKCIEKQDGEFKEMMTCLANNEYTKEEEENIKVCLTDSQIEWKGVPKMPNSLEESCDYIYFRWFGFNPVYYRFVDQCMKEKWTPDEYTNFECANILTIKTSDEIENACKSPSKEQKDAYLKFRECREKNEPPLERIKSAFECSIAKMIEHVTELKKAEAGEIEATTV
ncbi:uncharacterized protein LOC107367786 isoform X2 [Tetranychus urticae]|uniref:uncharacterized protein LOC107367786 isoform X2 n=1 Tax=Tetranychus urticae TaxID=32264 RepID=UPI00077BB97F|nr:uncharacterized protein LOC107367786 isoform X2 [Tetranychus urticae]